MTDDRNLRIRWIDRGVDPKNPPNPNYPNGLDVDLAADAERTCKRSLPYPAKRCGYFIVRCDHCRQQVVITTAGRPDDPRSIKLACKRYDEEAG